MGDQETGVVDFAAAFTLGMMLGAALALFMAPQSGEKTRKGLGKKGRKLKKEAGKQLEEAGSRVFETGEEWIGEAEARLGDLTAQISEAVDEGVSAIRDTVTREIERLDKRLSKSKKKGLFG